MKKVFQKIRSSLILTTVLAISTPLIAFLLVFLVYFYKDLKKETIIKYENEMGMLGYESASYLSHELKDLSENVHKISLKIVKKDTLTFEYLRGIINTIINSDKHIYGSCFLMIINMIPMRPMHTFIGSETIM